MPFPERKLKPIATFDLKKYVSENKRKLMTKEGPNEGFNPFMPSNPFMNPMSSGGFPHPQNTPMNDILPGLNKPVSSLTNEEIDKMIADIDKKLKELDEEEAREKAKLEHQEEKPQLPKKETNEEEDKPKINIDMDSVIMNDNEITDDEFFDDFFGDE